MALPAPRIAARLAALVLVLAFALLGPSSSSASGNACKRWGNASPETLTNGQAREAILCLVNEQRDDAGLPPLERDERLQKAAQRHTHRMNGTGCFAHECSGESALDGRLKSVGYLSGGLSKWAYGENIAWGLRDRGTPRAIVAAWMSSSGHRANILSRSFRELGVGFSSGTPHSKNDPGGIYTTDFGLRVG